MSLRHTLLNSSQVRRVAFVCDAVPSRRDPTGTGGTRRRFERDIVRRWWAIQKLIVHAVRELDVLGLGRQTNDSAVLAFFAAQPPAALVTDAAPPPRGFAFPRSQDRVAAFNDWLYSEMRRGVLEVQLGTPMRSAAENSWANVYLDTAYQKGIRDAYGKIGGEVGPGINAAFSRPIHADRVGLLYTRAFGELEGITDATAQAISRVLAGGLAEGRSPQELAKELYATVDDVSIVRSRALARTETIRAHAEGALNSYEEAGIEGVLAQAEFTTAGDERVCPQCAKLEGRVFSLAEARGLIPVHPNCRCAWLPVVK